MHHYFIFRVFPPKQSEETHSDSQSQKIAKALMVLKSSIINFRQLLIHPRIFKKLWEKFLGN
ncbi:hypothetical protein QE357_003110 [Siphonobacter sp. BAB-5404]|nr:hypothetical protein [Siphonobacter sp. SORGH_AS_0500]